MKKILIIRVPMDFTGDFTGAAEKLQDDYHIIVLADVEVSTLVFEYPRNCDLPQSDLDAIKEMVLVKLKELPADGKQ